MRAPSSTFTTGARQSPRHAAAWMEPPLTSQSATIVPYAAVSLAAVTMFVAVLRDGVDPFVFWVGLFLVAAMVARHVLGGIDRDALQKSVEAWVPLQRDALEDWIPAQPAPRPTRVGTGVS